MKNAINYYYNLNLNDIHQTEDGKYKFFLNNYNYVFTVYNRDLKDINILYDLTVDLLHYGLYTHQFIPNKDNQLLTYINGTPYVLLQVYIDSSKKITIEDIKKFSDVASNLNYNDNLRRDNWAQLWSNKIDYFEYQINQFGKSNPTIRESFSYFSGIVETGIELFNTIKREYKSFSVAHYRLKEDDSLYELYNPLNFIIDYRVRDACEYFKEKLMSRQEVIDIIISYLTTNNLSSYELLMFYTRMFYPSFYFDRYEDIMKNERDDTSLQLVINIVPKYEQLLKQIYLFLNSYIIMPQIEWIKKI